MLSRDHYRKPQCQDALTCARVCIVAGVYVEFSAADAEAQATLRLKTPKRAHVRMRTTSYVNIYLRTISVIFHLKVF